MKKVITITAALALTASFAAAASAATSTPAATTTPASVSTTVTGDTYSTVTSDVYGPVLVEPGDGIDLPLIPLEITKKTYFYDKPNGKRTGALSSQFVSVTGNEILNQMTGDTWVEIYTWKGIAWVNTGK